MKSIIEFILNLLILFIIALMIFVVGIRIGNILCKIERFVDNYKIYNNSFKIKENWLISIDPNENWIKFKVDPNCLEFKIKEK